jgi:tetratricopeptide (TPR) repeat protein
MRSTIFCASIFVLCSSVFAQAPFPLTPGLGHLHRVVTTKNAEAQRYFDQGLRYVYAFNHDAAVQSFKRATELDPDLAIGYWGMALALGPNINMDVDPEREKQAYDLAQTALAHAPHASPKERDMIDVLVKRYWKDPGADLKKLGAGYAAGMRELHAKYPDDPDIGALFAESLMDLHPWKFWTHDGKPTEDTLEIVSVLESVLKSHPKHMGANHYYIHAVEGSPSPQRALPSARRLTTLAPAAGHLVHMPAHVYQRTGNYAAAAEANAAGARADRVFVKAHGEGMYSMMYYNHNLDFGAASYAMDGRFAKAKQFADEVSANASKMVREMPPIEPFTLGSLKVLLRFGKWRNVLEAPDTNAGPYAKTFQHFARGVAFARLGNAAGARSEQKELGAAKTGLTDDTGFLQNSGKALATVMEPLLQGQIAEAEGNRDAAIAAYRRAVDAEDGLYYDEPADWFYPTRETLGGALLRNGNFADAEKVFRDDLARNPNNPRSLFGLAEALKKQKKPSAKTTAAFNKAWRGEPLRAADL